MRAAAAPSEPSCTSMLEVAWSTVCAGVAKAVNMTHNRTIGKTGFMAGRWVVLPGAKTFRRFRSMERDLVLSGGVKIHVGGCRRLGMSGDADQRRVVAVAEAGFEAYDLEGPVQPEITWQAISYD